MLGRWRTWMILVVFSLLLGGCWDHRPPGDSAFIILLGLDEDPDDPTMTAVTQLAVIPGGVAAGGQQQSPLEGTPFYLLSNKAPTLESAQASVLDHLSRIPALQHLDVIVFGQDFARAGRATPAAISWALRHPQIRPSTFVFVSEGPAQYFLDARPVLDPLPGEAIVGLMRNAERVHYIYPTRVYEFARSLLSPRTDVAVPLVGRVNPLTVQVPPGFKPQPFVGSGQGDETPEDTQIQLLGMAVFKGSRMVGTLTAEDGSGLNWIRGGNKGIVSIPHPEQPDHFVVALSVNSTAKRRARFEGERLILSIEVSAIMDAWGEGTFEPLAITKYLPQINRGLAGAIEDHIRITMERLQELRADIFGFGEELYRSSPADWEKVVQVWDDVYADAKLDINVDVRVRRTGFSR